MARLEKMIVPSAKALKFKAGEVVQLNSGGPLMTIVKDKIGKTTAAVLCEWFDKDQKLHTHKFPVVALRPAQSPLDAVREFLNGT